MITPWMLKRWQESASGKSQIVASATQTASAGYMWMTTCVGASALLLHDLELSQLQANRFASGP